MYNLCNPQNAERRTRPSFAPAAHYGKHAAPTELTVVLLDGGGGGGDEGARAPGGRQRQQRRLLHAAGRREETCENHVAKITGFAAAAVAERAPPPLPTRSSQFCVMTSLTFTSFMEFVTGSTVTAAAHRGIRGLALVTRTNYNFTSPLMSLSLLPFHTAVTRN